MHLIKESALVFELLGFSLLNACLRVSQQRNEVRMKQKPTCYAGGVKSLYRKTPFRYNRVVQSLLQERKGVLWRISLMISPIQNGCVNIILYLQHSSESHKGNLEVIVPVSPAPGM